ncbi:hypothetical protein EON77_13275, partial [bacterium]
MPVFPKKFRATLVVLASLASLTALAGCEREPSRPLLDVDDVVPREVETGERLEIVGAGFPQGRAAPRR